MVDSIREFAKLDVESKILVFIKEMFIVAYAGTETVKFALNKMNTVKNKNTEEARESREKEEGNE